MLLLLLESETNKKIDTVKSNGRLTENTNRKSQPTFNRNERQLKIQSNCNERLPPIKFQQLRSFSLSLSFKLNRFVKRTTLIKLSKWYQVDYLSSRQNGHKAKPKENEKNKSNSPNRELLEMFRNHVHATTIFGRLSE